MFDRANGQSDRGVQPRGALFGCERTAVAAAASAPLLDSHFGAPWLADFSDYFDVLFFYMVIFIYLCIVFRGGGGEGKEEVRG